MEMGGKDLGQYTSTECIDEEAEVMLERGVERNREMGGKING